MFSFFTKSLLHYPETVGAFTLPRKKRVLYFFFLALILLIPTVLPVEQTLHQFQNDSEVIARSIPDFDIKDGKIETNETKSFINRTKYFEYAYDPQDRIDEIDFRQSNSNALHFHAKSNELMLSIQDQTVVIPYSDTPLTGQLQKLLITQLTHSSWIRIILYSFTYLGEMLQLFFFSWLLTFSIGRSDLARTMHLSFGKQLGYSYAALTFPIVALSLFELLYPGIMVVAPFIALIWANLRFVYLSRHIQIIPIDKDRLEKMRKDKKDEDNEE